MKTDDIKGTEAWVEKINKHELPAFAATVRNLEKLADDDTASLPSLGKSVLHDQGLTTRILKVANSVTYRAGRNRVTTVSRAAVILGFDTIKHICITAKMIDSMLRNNDISENVYERLLKLMAKSFHSAMVARMLIGDRAEETQEEVYIATLLHELGEIAFWSIGGEITEKLDAALREKSGDKKDIVKAVLGTTFDQISIGLASTWNMGDLLIRSIEDPSRRTPEMRAIGLASDYSRGIVNKAPRGEIVKCVDGMSVLADMPVRTLKEKLKKCTEESVELAVSYGAKELTEYLDPNAEPETAEQEEVFHQPDEMVQLKLLRELTQFASEGADLNLLINTTIEGLHRGVGMDRVIVFMLNQTKGKLTPRFVSCQNADRIESGFVHPLSLGKTVFDESFKEHQHIWVNAPTAKEWRSRLTPALQNLCQGLAFFVAPIMVGKKCIGLLYVDRAESQRLLKSEDFDAFKHFAGQMSLCLSTRITK